MTDLYAIANDGWDAEITDSVPMMGCHEWEDHAESFSVERKFVEPEGVVLCVGGGAEVEILGDVSEGAIVMCAGGSARIKVHGRIRAGARVMAMGGGAEVVHGGAHPSAQVIARGGSAHVVDMS